MPDDLAELPCAACTQLAFDGRPSVQCGKCGTFVHRACWPGSSRCPVLGCGSKKWIPVAVVRLQPPGPSAAEIAAAVRSDFEEVLHPLVADIRSEMSHGSDVEKLRTELDLAAKAAAQRDERLQKRIDFVFAEVERRLDDHRRAVAEAQQAIRNLPTTGPKEFAEAARAVADTVAQRTDRLRDDLRAALAALDRTVVVESQRNLIAIEACRWDTGARRRPLPWDDRSDRVLDPAPGPEGPLEPSPGKSA